MKLIIGLGNPGAKYTGTRHNIGFETLEQLLKKYEPLKESSWENNKKTKSFIKRVSIKKIDTLLVQPQTFMNNSGMAVSLLLQYFKVDPTDMIVVHDELDLPLGKIQVRFGGGSAGHNGIESIIKALGTDKFLRVRMGIGKPMRVDGAKFNEKNHHTVDNYVLQHFLENEHHEVRTMIKHVQKNLELLLTHGIDTFMSKFNVKA
ncbi:MAG: aminoacyl-tRNA hydrolase [Candidatus Levybacteria bacterium]|nr:aminoacyl-tRNA hydrolase [Candidatus Levybacteria bacterium]